MYREHSNESGLDYAVHPGEIVEEILESKRMSAAEFSRRSGLTAKLISQILQGEAPVTPDTAVRMEPVLGVSANLLSNINANYYLFLARRKAATVQNRITREMIAWMKSFPIKELTTRGFLPDSTEKAVLVPALLSFFGVSDIKGWELQYGRMAVQFRHSQSFESTHEAVAAWLRIAETGAENISCEPYNTSGFRAALKEIRNLNCMAPKQFGPVIRELCRKSGVALVFVSEFRDTHLSGATQWLSSDKAMIALSLRHKTDDHFWFSFFHEAGHILLHGKKESFIDGQGSDAPKENEANEFAANILIPKDAFKRFIAGTGRLSEDAVKDFAREVNVSPGIVVGRLQHEGLLEYGSRMNILKRKFVLLEGV